MSKSFPNSSLGRDLSRMGHGPSGRGRGMNSAFKMGQQRSHGMSSGSSPQSLQSTFRLGSRGPASRDSDQASSLLASFGLSSGDLDELSRFPEDKITAENLPDIIQHLKRRRSENMEMSSNRERLSRDDLGPLRRASFGDRPSGHNPLGDFGRGGHSRELDYRERHIDDDLRDRERRVDRFLSELSFRKSESDYDRSRGIPSGRNIDDFHGLPPKGFPHLCSLCDLPLNSFQSWDAHISGPLHQKQRRRLLDLYPEWKGQGQGQGQGMGGGPHMVQRSPNRASGNMGPPMPPMGGPGPHRGNVRGPPGMEGMPGPGPRPRHMQKTPIDGRVVHVLDFERRNNMKMKLLKLVEPFGIVTNSLVLNTKNEAFIEMATPAQAKAAVNYYEMSPAHLYGKPIRVFMSLKYKQIKKDGTDRDTRLGPKPPLKPGLKKPFKQGPKPQPTEGIGRVLRLCNLPQTGYHDNAVLRLAKTFGKVKTYILMRKLRQAFVEMENAEDARAIVDRCARTPLKFKGKPLKILISQKYKTLVLRIPNATDKNRKGSRTFDGKDGGKKQKGKAEANKSDIITTEEDLVTDSCEAEEGEEAATILDASGSEDGAEAPEQDQNDTNKSAPAFHEHMEGFVTLDEIGSETSKKENENGAVTEQPAEEMEVDKSTASQTAAASEGELTADELGPYQPNVPTGVNYVIPKTGYYCRLCSLFYTNEDMAKVTHCSSLAHYQKLKNILNKPAVGKSPETKTEK